MLRKAGGFIVEVSKWRMLPSSSHIFRPRLLCSLLCDYLWGCTFFFEIKVCVWASIGMKSEDYRKNNLLLCYIPSKSFNFSLIGKHMAFCFSIVYFFYIYSWYAWYFLLILLISSALVSKHNVLSVGLTETGLYFISLVLGLDFCYVLFLKKRVCVRASSWWEWESRAISLLAFFRLSIFLMRSTYLLIVYYLFINNLTIWAYIY